MYAIIESGGKQYKVEAGGRLLVDRLEAAKGTTLDLGRVLLVKDGDRTLVGKPIVEGARVVAMVQGEVKGPKITVQKFKPKTNYHVKLGHRQIYSDLAIKEILLRDTPAGQGLEGQLDGT